MRAGAATRLLEVEAPNFGNQNISGHESSDDSSNDYNVFEFRERSKDVQLETSSMRTSDDSTLEASLPRAIRVGSKDLQFDDESTEDNVFEFRARSKDVQLENPSTSTSDNLTPKGSLPRAIRVGSKGLQLENPGTSTSDSTPEASPLRYFRAKSKDVRLKSTSSDSTPDASPPRYIRVKSKDVRLENTSDDSTPEGSPPTPWGLWRSWHR